MNQKNTMLTGETSIFVKSLGNIARGIHSPYGLAAGAIVEAAEHMERMRHLLLEAKRLQRSGGRWSPEFKHAVDRATS
ncbi:MAG TPA: hypothetical protein PK752_06010 [Accumulibacter sp.]|uniref:hypothetical protein n=1 Tax=Accumulibacter sp. TaxID=2053492 RepID=UPI002D02BBF2|nr:hypothetical protein [Accumulibacter sp.]HRD87804.1 hypothetical protein [Accumulibacter sp.]